MDSWSAKNTLNPRQIFMGSEKKCIFDCRGCSTEYIAMIYNITLGNGCPFCKNKTEGAMHRFLSEHHDVQSQARFPWCRFSETGRIMPFDFMVDDVLIELDGEQHFSQVSNWDAPEKTQQKDVEKIRLALANGYSVIHLLQTDVWKNVYDWKTALLAEIEALRGATPCCVFLQSCEKYGVHAGEIVGAIVKNPKMVQANASAEEV
jgi:very-short-patch-repair endonuclease